MDTETIEKEILHKLETCKEVDTRGIEGTYSTVIRAVKRLESAQQIEAVPVQCKEYTVTQEGEEVAQKGSPEYTVYKIVDTEMTVQEIEQRIAQAYTEYSAKHTKDIASKGVNNGIKCGMIKVHKGVVTRAQSTAEDKARMTLQLLISNASTVAQTDIDALVKRKLVAQKKMTHYKVAKGACYGTQEKLVSDITVEMLQSMRIGASESKESTVQTAKLKKYNFDIVSVPAKYSGALHPLAQEREKVKQIFLQMGFEEMDAAKYVESSFWNFDALFQPQRHPSRNEHDTFFIDHPKHAQDPPAEYLQRVEEVHTKGGYGSIGYQAPWSIEESRKNVLRTHTTAVTTRLLHALAHTKHEGKYFSIDRVFRNESLDATHLAEFHQVEGIVIGKGLTISHLMGFIDTFFRCLGIEKLKFKPAYNPYTEPSVEIFAYHEEMKKWMEIGNSGMFRPEMLLPMGYDEDVRVIGWGISLERPVMIARHINNIRDLVGHRVDLSFIRGEGQKKTS